MKTLKVRSVFFSLMAVMALSVLMISCEQEPLGVIGDEQEGIRPAEVHGPLGDIDVSDLEKYQGKNLFIAPDGTIYIDEGEQLRLPEPSEITISGKPEIEGEEEQKSGCCYLATPTFNNAFKMKFSKYHTQNLYIYHYAYGTNVYLGTSLVTSGGCGLQTFTSSLSFVPSNIIKVKSHAFIYDGGYCTQRTYIWKKFW